MTQKRTKTRMRTMLDLVVFMLVFVLYVNDCLKSR